MMTRSVGIVAFVCSAVLCHGTITMEHYTKAVLSDATAMYNKPGGETWDQALTVAWNDVKTMRSPSLYMLQATLPVSALLINTIEGEEEIKLDHFAPPDLFFFFAIKEQATNLRKMQQVQDVQAVPHALKISPSLRALLARMATDNKVQADVLIELSPGSKGSFNQVQTLAAGWQSAVAGGVPGSNASFTAEASDLIALRGTKGTEMAKALAIVASQPEASVLEEIPDNNRDDPQPPFPYDQDIKARRRANDEADDITQSGEIGKVPLRDAGLTGLGEVVGIADSGLDDNSCFFNANNNLARDKEPDFSQRKVIQYIAFADSLAGEPNDHGTHVAGSVAGSCTIASGKIYDGMAPDAKIHFFDIGLAGKSSLDVPRNLRTGLFPFAKEAGAAIHTNSWGANTNRYTSNARDVDQYSVENEEFVILIAAGNSGAQGRNSVGSPATAKNCIAVGASVNKKRGNINDIASFSSIGPAADGRIKPDVVAPGHNILSAASLKTCSITSQSGTSMATPVTAGNVALVRQYFREGWHPSGVKSAADAFTPSGALLKAMIIHSGKIMTGDVKGDKFPGVVQGFGRIDMDSLLKLGATMPERGTLWVRASKVGQTVVELAEGQTFEKTFKMNKIGTMKATLVWMDPPSSLNARTNLVNDLDLLILHDNTQYFPNGGNARDNINNVEMVEATAMTRGTYTVRVTANAIRSGTSQRYALVVTGPFTAPSTTAPAPPGAPPTPDPTPTPTPAPPTPEPTPGTAPYAKIMSGSCANPSKFAGSAGPMAPIKDVPTCIIAAAFLGLSDVTPTRINGSPRPEGCYYKDERLYLGENPVNIGRGVVEDRVQICKAIQKTYEKLTTGSCAEQGLHPITNAASCEAAALELGLDDQTASVIRFGAPRPEGCYYKSLLPGNALFISTSEANLGLGSAGGREQICSYKKIQAQGSVEGIVASNSIRTRISVFFGALMLIHGWCCVA